MLAPGIHEMTLDNGQRLAIAIPTGYTGEESVPLIMALHYGGTAEVTLRKPPPMNKSLVVQKDSISSIQF